MAAAAADVLAYLIPAEAADFRGLAEEAGRSRFYAGLQYPSDYSAGLELGRKVAAQVIQKARADEYYKLALAFDGMTHSVSSRFPSRIPGTYVSLALLQELGRHAETSIKQAQVLPASFNLVANGQTSGTTSSRN